MLTLITAPLMEKFTNNIRIIFITLYEAGVITKNHGLYARAGANTGMT